MGQLQALSITASYIAILPFIAAQQFPDLPTPFVALGVSAGCLEALNTTTHCSAALARNTPDFQGGDVVPEVMALEDLDAICNPQCRSSLVAIRAKVLSACSKYDFFSDNSTYPATYFADRLLLAYDSSCYKDKTTGKYCGELLNEWSSSNTSHKHDCHDCVLGPLKIMLESSLSYDDDAEQDFKSLTASCKAPGNDYTAATGYLSTPSPAKAALTVPASWCASKYTVKAGDTCDSISLTNSVSTFGIVHANGLFLSCENLPSTGNQICLPPKCAIKRIHYGHTCLGLAEMYGVTEAQLVDWNPNFDSACLTIGRWYHTHICVSPPGGSLDTQSTTTPTSTAAPVPDNTYTPSLPTQSPIAPGSRDNCIKYHNFFDKSRLEAKFGKNNAPALQNLNRCGTLAGRYKITFDDLLAWNPSLDREDCRLQKGYSYCVQTAASGKSCTL